MSVKKKREGVDIKTQEVYVLTYRQDELNWRIIVFLPFNLHWKMMMVVFSIILFILTIYEAVFLQKRYRDVGMNMFERTITLIMICNILDFVLSVLHRIWMPVQKSMPYEPKSFPKLVIDLISVLPFRYTGSSVFIEKNTINWVQICDLNRCLKIFSVLEELNILHQYWNPILICMIQYNVLLLFLASLFAVAWYTLGIHARKDGVSWVDDVNINNINISIDNPFEIFTYCFIQMMALLVAVSANGIVSTNINEVIFIIFAIIVGWIVRLTYVVGYTVQSFLKYQGHLYNVRNHLEINEKSLKTIKDKKQLDKYYNTFWNNWLGLYKCPMLDKFPICLQKDIFTDVYWNALDHSHVLRHFPINIKREISLYMKSKFFQPGDYIYRKGEVRTTFYYLSDGVAQIMSHYDGSSPIVTISSGSCIGGLALMLPTKCPTDVVCITTCEVRYLSYMNLHAALTSYPNGSALLQRFYKDILKHVKLMYILSERYNIVDPVMKLYGVPLDDKLKWIKHRWRILKNYESEIPKDVNVLIEPLPIEVRHTSKYLDVLTLSSEVTYNADKCCVRSTCPYILDPNCNFVRVWLSFIIAVITIDCLIVPYSAAFVRETTDAIVYWEHIVCFLYLIDVYFQIITSVKTIDETIMEPMAIFRYHIKDVFFIIDLIGSLPARAVARIFIPEHNIPSITAVLRLLKIVRIAKYLKIKNNCVTTNVLVTHFMKSLYIYFFLIYFFSCLAFIRTCEIKAENLLCHRRTWLVFLLESIYVVESADVDYIVKLSDVDVFQFFLLGAYRAAYFVLTCGTLLPATVILYELVLLAVLIGLSKNILNYNVSELIAMWVMKTRREKAYHDLINSVKICLNQKNIHPGLINMFVSFVELQWKVNKAIYININVESSEIMSPVLYNENQRIISEGMKKVPLFEYLNNQSYNKIAKGFRIFTVPEDYIFCLSGEHPTSFNIILKGYCNLTSMLREDVQKFPEGKIIGPGKYFPLMEVLQRTACLQTTVSITACEVLTLETELLHTILSKDNFYVNNLNKIIDDYKSLMSDIVISNKMYRKETKPIKNIIYDCRSQTKTTEETSSCLRCFVEVVRILYNPPFMIHPSGDLLLWWETFKTLQIVLTLLYVPTMFTLFCSKRFQMFLIPLELFSFADLIVRSYVGHYNNDGVAINESGYYFQHAFAVDFLSTVPLYLYLSDYKISVQFFVTMVLKLLQIYRISGLFMAYRRRFNVDNFKMMLFSTVVNFIVVMNVAAHSLLCVTCTMECQQNGLYEATCNENTWLSRSVYYKNVKQPVGYVLGAANTILFIVLSNDLAAFWPARMFEIKLFFLLSVLGVAFKLYYIPNAVRYLIGRHLSFTIHRANHRLFWTFIKTEGEGTEIANKMFKHMTYNFFRTRGININEVFRTVHPSLQYDLTMSMYYRGMLCLHKFVGPSKIFMKLLSSKVDEYFYRSNSTIIYVNEINDKLYFICEGYVVTYNSENEVVRTLSPGSMFGCFNTSSKRRHRLKYVSMYNTQLLGIPSFDFFRVLYSYNREHYEYFIKKSVRAEFVEHKEKYQMNQNLVPVVAMKEPAQASWLHEDNTSVRIVKYFLSVVFPIISSYPILFTISVPLNDKIVLFMIFIYILDAISLLRIFLGLNTSSSDAVTGIMETSMSRIRLQYMRNPNGFLLDFISAFPFEVIGYVATGKWIDVLRINRLLRMIMFLNHMREHAEITYVRTWLRWSEFIVCLAFIPMLFTALWLYVTCSQFGFVRDEPVNSPYQVFLIAFKNILHMITLTANYAKKKPENITECLMIMFISIVAFFLFVPFCIGKYVDISLMNNYNKHQHYDFNVYRMKLYFRLRNLSPCLLEKLWNYSTLLCKTNNGHYYPPYIQSAPFNMRCELLRDLYGGHITFNILFEECDRDFIFQLCGYLNRTVYFPGDFIVRKFDADQLMYFINSGEVEELEFNDLYFEVVKDIYITGQCFGLSQGLYERKVHLNYYKARTMVEMLTLNRNEWQDLVMHFPKDYAKILKVSHSLSLDSLH